MRKYLFFLLIVTCFPSSYGNQRLDRSTNNKINLNQYDFELRTNTLRNESQLLNFIETTIETHLIPGLQISIVKGGNIVWNKHFGYANINENILVDENTMFILSSASKTITATALMHLFQQNLFYHLMRDRIFRQLMMKLQFDCFL